MCRYAFHEYRDHYACFDCRKTFKYDAVRDDPKCPQCAKTMVSMGLDFKTPRQNDDRQWRKVKILTQHGYKFGSCGCSGPGERPKRLSEVKEFLQRDPEHRIRRG
jgi:DNA-directed RNA polymerase subunit RPC12/RpoP